MDSKEILIPGIARDAQEDAAYYALLARVDMEKGDIESARFFQEESAYFAELARNLLAVCE